MGNSCSDGANPPANTTHSIYVKTSDKKGAGTDGNIYITLADEKGVWSGEEMVDTKWKDDFEKGNTDVFHLELPGVGRITELQIRRDGTAASDSWHLEKITVGTVDDQPQSVFPVHRWIHANTCLPLVEFDSALPQFDKHSEQRAKELEKKREAYKLQQKAPGLPFQVVNLPKDERFSNEYQWDIATTKLKLILETKYIDFTTSDFESLEDIKKVYKVKLLPVPAREKNWKSDEVFGNQRLTGCNPVMLRLCQTIPEHFAVTAEMVEPFLEGQTLSNCLELKKIYILDLTYLAHIKYAEGRVMPGPTGLFYSNKNGYLMPLAIQLMPQPAEDNPVFLPSDPEYTWLAAKLWFNLADASHHQSVVHLGHTHLLMESVVTCSHRQLSPSHPIFKLLAPHFLYLLAINTRAVNKLLTKDGWVDTAMHTGSEGMYAIVAKNYAEFDVMDQGNLPADLKKRGVDDVEALPNYHYRDDALLLWNALHKYVASVVNQVYDTEDKLSGDHELQGWAKEISEVNLKGVPAKFSAVEDLVKVITCFIFICSVEHAASNFGQYDEYAYPPNYPTMLRKSPPTDKRPLTEDDIVAYISPKRVILDVLVVAKLLSRRGTKELGNFEVQYAHDPASLKALAELQADLHQTAATIDERNAKRVQKYPYLNPREVPNSISI